jgi:PTS system mannose-specific IID component
MQNLGFAYAIIPLLREKKLSGKDEAELLTRHLQMFNTHPYLSTPLIGSIIRMEEGRQSGEDASSIIMVKQSLMGPYAAIGDTFFWGALRPCAGIFAVALAWMGWILAPLAFMMIYMPVHIWVRAKGFIEGYRQGKQGIEFVRRIDLPRIASRVRWLSLIVLAGFGACILQGGYSTFTGMSRLVVPAAALAIILICWLLIKKGVSQVYLLYGAAVLFLIFSSKELLMCWK